MASVNGSDRRQSGHKQDPNEKPTLMSNPHNPSSAAYLAYPVKHVFSSLYRRATEPPDQPVNKLLDAPNVASSGMYTPPKRSQSPFQPPPLTSLDLQHDLSAIDAESLLLSRSLAEEIRLLIPPRLQLVDHWRLAYSLEVHGSSLATLYDHSARISPYQTQRSGYILVVKDGSTASAAGSVFGAYLTDFPKPATHYFGTGECFLWRASILPTLQNITLTAKSNGNAPPSQDVLELAGLPPPPSADTTNTVRTTTIKGQRRPSQPSSPTSPRQPPKDSTLLQPPPAPRPGSGTSTPDRIRFKAFPYSGMNDFMIYCTSEYLSIGGGDGHYGLWLDDALDNGISETCPTFGNEPLSEEGKKFEVLGVEVWYVGA